MNRILLAIGFLILLDAAGANAQTSHTVALTWTQSNVSGLKANKVYRSTANGLKGTAVYTSTSPVTSYTDKGPLTDGVTYYYCVTVLLGSNNESACSKQVSATIPAAPRAPTAISVTIN